MHRFLGSSRRDKATRRCCRRLVERADGTDARMHRSPSLRRVSGRRAVVSVTRRSGGSAGETRPGTHLPPQVHMLKTTRLLFSSFEAIRRASPPSGGSRLEGMLLFIDNPAICRLNVMWG